MRNVYIKREEKDERKSDRNENIYGLKL